MSTGIGSPLALGGLYPSVDGRYVAANGKPFTSVSNAESALNGFPSKLSESCVGLTVLVKESGWTEAKEYWVQPYDNNGITAYHLVDKMAKAVQTESSIPANPTPEERGHVPTVGAVADALAGKMNAGQAFKTINGESVVGSGDLNIDMNNPFKGWYKTGDTLPTDGFDGAYLYFKDTTQTHAVTTIYQWNGTTYADTGTEVDESNVQTFETGQAVNSVRIAENIAPSESGLAKSGDVFKCVEDKVVAVGSVNLFDKTKVETSCYWDSNGRQSKSSYVSISGPILVKAGVSYKAPFNQTELGRNHVIAKVDSEKNFLGYYTGNVADGYITFTATTDGYVSFNVGTNGINSFMVCKVSEYPESYVAYEKKIGGEYRLNESQLNEVRSIATGLDKELENTYIQEKTSVNLFNRNSSLIQVGYWDYNGTLVTSSTNYRVSHPIFVKGGVTYKAPTVQGISAGTLDMYIQVDKLGNKIAKKSGTVSDGYLTFTPSDDMYVSLNLGNGSYTYFMVCKESEYPESFVKYYYYKCISDDLYVGESGGNPLLGKSAIFTGDSICAGVNDTENAIGGWAKRIGNKNKMQWVNKAVGGGTIVDKSIFSSPSSFTISDTDFGDGADYIILEGGTNDADRIGSILDSSNLPAAYGSYNLTDYTTEFGNQTFCDAVQRLIQRVVLNYPTAKVGFIIAMKMGDTSFGYSKETNNRRAYFETIIQICKKWGVPVLNLWDECTMNPHLSTRQMLYQDTQHPNNAGYDLLAPIIEEWMKGL